MEDADGKLVFDPWVGINGGLQISSSDLEIGEESISAIRAWISRIIVSFFSGVNFGTCKKIFVCYYYSKF